MRTCGIHRVGGPGGIVASIPGGRVARVAERAVRHRRAEGHRHRDAPGPGGGGGPLRGGRGEGPRAVDVQARAAVGRERRPRGGPREGRRLVPEVRRGWFPPGVSGDRRFVPLRLRQGRGPGHRTDLVPEGGGRGRPAVDVQGRLPPVGGHRRRPSVCSGCPPSPGSRSRC